MNVIHFFISLNLLSVIAIFVLFFKYRFKNNKKINDMDSKFNEEIEEVKKRICIVSNALPRTTKEGALGYKVTFADQSEP